MCVFVCVIDWIDWLIDCLIDLIDWLAAVMPSRVFTNDITGLCFYSAARYFQDDTWR